MYAEQHAELEQKPRESERDGWFLLYFPFLCSSVIVLEFVLKMKD
jgi:hypothetical protein